jgi:hypothetical protein
VFYEPRSVYRGRDEIDRVAATIKATHPDFRYQPIAARRGNEWRNVASVIFRRPDSIAAFAEPIRPGVQPSLKYRRG